MFTAEHYLSLSRAIELEVGNAWRDALEALTEDNTDPCDAKVCSSDLLLC